MNQRNALISVYNKDSIVEFTKELTELGFNILSSGGTAKVIDSASIPVKDIADMVGKPILGHKVVTLSREIHAALLADPNNPAEMKELATENIPVIHLVCVDFYPLEQEINDPESTRESVIAKTDIGGPTMISSAAKGGRIVICDPDDREVVIHWLKEGEPDKEVFVNKLRAKADFVVSRYRALSANFHSDGDYLALHLKKSLHLKYGENPHQKNASFYKDPTQKGTFPFKEFIKMAGGPIGFINMTDMNNGLNTLRSIGAALMKNTISKEQNIVVGVKHSNVCGAASHVDRLQALRSMINGDPDAIFGGTVVTNFAITRPEAEILSTYKWNALGKRPLDVVVAPGFVSDAIARLKRKDDRCIMMKHGFLTWGTTCNSLPTVPARRPVLDGMIEMDAPKYIFDRNHPEMILHSGKITNQQIWDMSLGWGVMSRATSNTITLVKDGMVLANIVGRQARHRAAKDAIAYVKEFHPNVTGFVACSDSFFPFPDGPQILINGGAAAIYATRGSRNDNAVIEMCKDVTFVTIPDKIGRAFYGHC